MPFSGIARVGSNLKWYGATARGGVFMGNQYVKTFSIARGARIAGYASAGIGVLMDIKGVINHYDNPNSPNAVSPGKAGVNTGFTAYGLFINPAAPICYFGIDAFYPGGWLGDGTNPGAIIDQAQLLKGNQEIVPGFNLYNDARGNW